MGQTTDRVTLADRLPGIVAALGDGWQGACRSWDGQVQPDAADLTAPSGMALHLHANGYRNRGRIEIGISWPRDAGNNIYRPRDYGDDEFKGIATSITVAETKTDAQIATEIGRRLYNRILPAWQAMCERAASSNAYRSQGYGFALKIGAAFGVEPRGRYSRDVDPGADEHTIYIAGLPTVRVTGSGASFEIRSIAPDFAIQILKAIQKGGAE